MFWGSIIFEFIGVCMRYLFQFLLFPIKRNKLKTFAELWKGPVYEESISSISYGFSNILIGFSTIIVLVLLSFLF